MVAEATPTVELRLVSSDETAMVLRRNLGAGRSWSDFLADMRRGKSSGLNGLTLSPYSVARHAPLYHPADIANFMALAKMQNPEMGPEPLTAMLYRVPDVDGLPWKMRKAVPVPVHEAR